MGVKINLLPPDLASGASLSKISGFVKKLNLFLLSFLLVFGSGVAAFLSISSIQLGDLGRREASLKAQIIEMETTETRMILLKDRIGKIKIAKSSENVNTILDAISPLLAQVGADSTVPELNLDSQKIELSVNFESPASLSGFFRYLEGSTSFDSIVLTSFGFNPSTGYLVNLKLTPKS